MPVTPHKNIEDSEQQHFVSSRKSRSSDEAKNLQPPLTPMIDVTFQLLLYFLLTSTFRADEGLLPGSLPGGASQTKDTPIQPIRISIAPEGPNRDKASFTIGNFNPTTEPQQMYEYLMRRGASGNREEIPVLIQSSGFVRWKYVVEAFNQSVRAKFKKIGFAPAS